MVLNIAINTNNSVQHSTFICTQLKGSKYAYLLQLILFSISHLFAYLTSFTSQSSFLHSVK